MNLSQKKILQLARKYGVTATPVLIIADEEGELLKHMLVEFPSLRTSAKSGRNTKYDSTLL